MTLSPKQATDIAELEAAATSVLQASPPDPWNTPDYSGIQARMADIALEEVPLDALGSLLTNPPNVVVGMGANVATRVPTASAKVTILDRTAWAIGGVTIEIWSQAQGTTGILGDWTSPRFLPGTYPFKLRSDFTGSPSGGPDDAVVPWEVARSQDFAAGLATFHETLGLAAGHLTAKDRARQVLLRAAAAAPREVGDQLRGLVSPVSIGIFATMAALWAVGQFVGVGEIADAAALVSILVELGFDVMLAYQVVTGLKKSLTAVVCGVNEFQLKAGGEALAGVTVQLGAGKLIEFFTKAVKSRVSPSGEYRPSGAPAERKTVSPADETPPTPGALSPLAAELSGIMGDAVYAKRAAAIDACIAQHPELAACREEDLVALRGYTSHEVTQVGPAATSSAGASAPADYKVFNNTLRGGDPTTFGRVAPYVDAALRAFDNLPAEPDPTKSFRGMPRGVKAVEAVLKRGRIFMDKGFFSTSKSEKAARGYGGKASVTPPPMLIITIRGYSGRSLAKISEVDSDAELLFRPGTRFFVSSRREIAGNLLVSIYEIRPGASSFVSLWGYGAVLLSNLRSLRRQPAAAADSNAP